MAKTQSAVLTALRGKDVIFSGKFAYGHEKQLSRMAQAHGGTVGSKLSPATDFLVLADIAAGKTIQKSVASLNAKGARIQLLDVGAFLKRMALSSDQVLALIRGGKKNASVLQDAMADNAADYYRDEETRFTIIAEKFDNLDLSEFHFSKIRFDRCSFIAIKAGNHTWFDGASNCDFSKADMPGASVYELQGSRFVKANCKDANFNYSLEKADFSGACLDEATFDGGWVAKKRDAGVKFRGASLRSASFDKVKLDAPDFENADLRSAKMEECEWKSANFRSAVLQDTDWSQCKLAGANFTGASLRNANFGDTDLTGAVFRNADLKDVNLSGAKTRGADFSKAKNYDAGAKVIGKFGKAVLEYSTVARQARRLGFTFGVEASKGKAIEKAGVDTRDLSYITLPDTLKRARGYRTSPGDALMELASRIVNWKIHFETLEIDHKKSPVTGPALREIVINAIAEATGQTPPAADTLAAAMKVHRGEKAEQDAKKAMAASKQAAAKTKRVAKKIEKTVGKITDIATFLKALELRTDSSKISKATKMLRADRFQLFNDVTPEYLNGVVKSQTDRDLVYACRIESDGHYACCTQNLNICGGLRGGICKHLLVLIIGLVKAGKLDPGDIDRWIAKTQNAKPELNKETMGEIFIRYKGAEAGEVDWRPTETVPEDYYAV